MHSFIKQSAVAVGFDACGIARAECLHADAEFLEKWLADGKHGEMHYLERNREKRTNPQILVPECKSVVVVLLNYFNETAFHENSPKIALYACPSMDYHSVIKQKLSELENLITDKYGKNVVNQHCQHRFVDSAPVLERRWAERAGLGWIGRNKNLIASGLGSFCFIGVLLLNVETEYDTPAKNLCGPCRKCIDACPSKALTDEGFDARRCISYQTVEKRGTIDSEICSKLSGYVAGCDICTLACPHNKRWAKPHNCPELALIKEVAQWKNEDWQNISETQYRKIFSKTALSRLGFEKFKESITFSIKKMPVLN